MWEKSGLTQGEEDIFISAGLILFVQMLAERKTFQFAMRGESEVQFPNWARVKGIG